MKSAAFYAGAKAGADAGKTHSDNPYEFGSDEHLDWNEGYIKGANLYLLEEEIGDLTPKQVEEWTGD